MTTAVKKKEEKTVLNGKKITAKQRKDKRKQELENAVEELRSILKKYDVEPFDRAKIYGKTR